MATSGEYCICKSAKLVILPISYVEYAIPFAHTYNEIYLVWVGPIDRRRVML